MPNAISPLPSVRAWAPAWDPFWGRAVEDLGRPGSPPARAQQGSSPPRPLPTTPSCSLPPPSRSGTHRSQSPLKCSKLLKEEKSYLMFSQITMTICSLLILNTFDDTIYCLSNFHFMSQPFLRWAECFCAILLRDPYLATAVWPTAKSWAKSGERTEER